MNIGSDQLDQALLALNDQLALRDGSVHLIVIGGSGLIAIDAVSRATRDVDVVALERDGELVSAEPLPAAVRDSAATVARDLGLEANWLNAGPTGLLLHGLPVSFVERLVTRDYGPALRVVRCSRRPDLLQALRSRGSKRSTRFQRSRAACANG